MSKAKTMKRWTVGCAFGMAVALMAALPAGAHHSFAMYDTSKVKTLTGKVQRFVPGANHASLFFELIDSSGQTVTGEDGQPVEWGVEMGPAPRIAQHGVTVENFPEGTVVTVKLNPLKDGRKFGSLARVEPIIKCGSEMPVGGCTDETGEVFTLGEP